MALHPDPEEQRPLPGPPRSREEMAASRAFIGFGLSATALTLTRFANRIEAFARPGRVPAAPELPSATGAQASSARGARVPRLPGSRARCISAAFSLLGHLDDTPLRVAVLYRGPDSSIAFEFPSADRDAILSCCIAPDGTVLAVPMGPSTAGPTASPQAAVCEVQGDDRPIFTGSFWVPTSQPELLTPASAAALANDFRPAA